LPVSHQNARHYNEHRRVRRPTRAAADRHGRELGAIVGRLVLRALAAAELHRWAASIPALLYTIISLIRG
jgi:hypothetical protein